MKYRTAYPNELCHYGVLGMKWGVRRYQNYDGTRIGTGGAPVIKPSSLKGGVQRVGTGEAQRSSIPNALKKSVAGGQGGRAKGTVRLAAMAGGSQNGDSNSEEAPKKKSLREAVLEPSVKKGKGKDDTSVAQEVTKSTANIVKESKELAKEFKKTDPRVKAEQQKQERSQMQKARKMSDKELRDNINRIKMEKEYVSLTTKETKTGYDKVINVLDKAEPFVKIAAEIAGLVLLLYKVKKAMHAGLDDYSIEDDRSEIYDYCVNNNIDSDVIVHAMAFDLDYILDYYNISEEELTHILNDLDEEYIGDYIEHLENGK